MPKVPPEQIKVQIIENYRKSIISVHHINIIVEQTEFSLKKIWNLKNVLKNKLIKKIKYERFIHGNFMFGMQILASW